jgi:hypothetical protein
LYKQKVEQLQDALQDPSIRQEVLEVLRELIERVSMVPTNDGFEIEPTGEITKCWQTRTIRHPASQYTKVR